MSLREDLEAMERHQRNGTLKEWFEGTAPILPVDDNPSDPTAGRPGMSTYRWITLRGD